jgi:hypothetical protein
MFLFSFNHPEQRHSRDSFRIQGQGLCALIANPEQTAEWALKQVQGDEL